MRPSTTLRDRSLPVTIGTTTATCVDCGAQWQTTAGNARRCEKCRKVHDDAYARAYQKRRREAKQATRKQALHVGKGGMS